MFPKILMPKPKVKIVGIIGKTMGKKHCWCKATIGNGIYFDIRKPIGSVKNLLKV